MLEEGQAAKRLRLGWFEPGKGWINFVNWIWPYLKIKSKLSLGQTSEGSPSLSINPLPQSSSSSWNMSQCVFHWLISHAALVIILQNVSTFSDPFTCVIPPILEHLNIVWLIHICIVLSFSTFIR